MFRVGVLAGLRSKKLDGKTIGVMVTASHNPEAVRAYRGLHRARNKLTPIASQDNGVKLVDPRGEMLEAAWEGHATVLANAPSTEAFIEALEVFVKTVKIDLSKPSRVVYARDTRPSRSALVASLEDGFNALDVVARDAGVTTTPILPYLVCAINTKGTKGEDTEEGYTT